MNKQLPEAIKHFEKSDEYFSCPHSCGAVYAKESFTHNPFICKDCNQEFSIPKGIKLNKPKQFKKRPVKQGA